MEPLFSIVIANYNYGRFLGSAIESVLSQTFQLFELIICDAASSDHSVEIIKKYAGGLESNVERSLADSLASGSHITWWCSERDRGQSHAFNKGFSHAKGRFLTWLNADDMLYPTALESIARVIQKYPRGEWFVGSSIWVDNDLKVIRCFCAHNFSMLRARYGFLTAGGPSSFFSRRLYESAGMIDESLHYLMDTDLWYKFYRECGVKYRRTKENVWIFRVHDDSKTTGSSVANTNTAIGNRLRYEKETAKVAMRYCWGSKSKERIVTVLTCSLIDFIISRVRTLIWRGRKIS